MQEQSALQRMWDEARGNPHQSAQDFQSINYQREYRFEHSAPSIP